MATKPQHARIIKNKKSRTIKQEQLFKSKLKAVFSKNISLSLPIAFRGNQYLHLMLRTSHCVMILKSKSMNTSEVLTCY